MEEVSMIRRIQFEGNQKNNTLLIGNHGDVEFVAKGSFDLSGLVYCSKSTLNLTVIGSGVISFHGVCRKLEIDYVNGDCLLDFSKLSSKEITCHSLKGRAVILLGPTRIISNVNLNDDVVLKYTGKPLITSYSIKGNSRMEPGAEQMTAKVAVA